MTTLTRRSALKALAAAVLAPCWRIEPAPRRRINLAEFCRHGQPLAYCNGNRYDMASPFVTGDHTYATDARVAVRVAPEAGDKRQGGPIPPPPAAGLPWWDHDRLRGWREWPERPEVVTCADYCLRCEGRGYLGEAVDCVACQGLGRLYHAGDWEVIGVWVDCEACDGSGHTGTGGRCPDCHGQPWGAYGGLVQLRSGLWVDVHYWRKVAATGGAEWWAPADSGDGKPIRWRCGDGDGLLMPLEALAASRRIQEARQDRDRA